MPEGVRSVNVDALGVDFTSLVDLIRTRAGDWGVAGILLCGSFARREVDVASDIDLIVAVEATTRSIQVGTWMGRDIEILYMSLESLAAHRPTRGTLRGAAVLYDPQDCLAPLVRQWEAHFAEPRQTPPAEREYGRWEIAHTLTVMERLAVGAPRATLLYVRNDWVSDVVGYLFDSAGDWPPTRRHSTSGRGRDLFVAGRLVTARVHECSDGQFFRKSASCTMSVCRVQALNSSRRLS